MSMSTTNDPRLEPSNVVIAHTLQWLAVLLEIDDRDAQRVVAHRHAAHQIRHLDQPVSELVKLSGAAGLERVGVEPSVAALVAEWIRTGELPVLAEAQRQRPGLWPALTHALCKTLGIEPAPARPPRRSVPRPPRRSVGPIHRQVWESWN